jgi:hypothetical protein
LPFKLPQDLLGKRGIEVVRDRESPGTEAERSRAGLRCGDGPELGDRMAAADHDKVFPGLNPVQQCLGVTLKLLEADGSHDRSVADPRKVPIVTFSVAWRESATGSVSPSCPLLVFG